MITNMETNLKFKLNKLNFKMFLPYIIYCKNFYNENYPKVEHLTPLCQTRQEAYKRIAERLYEEGVILYDIGCRIMEEGVENYDHLTTLLVNFEERFKKCKNGDDFENEFLEELLDYENIINLDNNSYQGEAWDFDILNLDKLN